MASGVGGAIANAIGSHIPILNGAIGRGLIEGAFDDALTQGVGKATGLQKNFSWASVAAAGVS